MILFDFGEWKIQNSQILGWKIGVVAGTFLSLNLNSGNRFSTFDCKSHLRQTLRSSSNSYSFPLVEKYSLGTHESLKFKEYLWKEFRGYDFVSSNWTFSADPFIFEIYFCVLGSIERESREWTICLKNKRQNSNGVSSKYGLIGVY